MIARSIDWLEVYPSFSTKMSLRTGCLSPVFYSAHGLLQKLFKTQFLQSFSHFFRFLQAVRCRISPVSFHVTGILSIAFCSHTCNKFIYLLHKNYTFRRLFLLFLDICMLMLQVQKSTESPKSCALAAHCVASRPSFYIFFATRGGFAMHTLQKGEDHSPPLLSAAAPLGTQCSAVYFSYSGSH